MRAFRIAAWIPLIFVCSCAQKPAGNVQGFLDFRESSMETPVALDGTWDFFPGLLGQAGTPVPFRMPGTWNGVGGAEAHGCGTLHIRVMLGKAGHRLALRIPDIGTASRILINGAVAGETGRPSCTRGQDIERVQPRIILLPDTKILDLELQMSNFTDRKGGPWGPVVLGPHEVLDSNRVAALGFDAILAGATILMGFYHISLFAVRRKDRGPLWFGIFCLLIGLRSVLTGERFLLTYLPNLPFEVTFRAEYVTAYFAAPVFIHFFYHIRPDRIRPWLVRLYDLASWPVCLGVLVLPLAWTTQTLPYYHGVIAVATAGVLFRTIQFSLEGDRDARMGLLGVIVLSVCVVLDILHNEKVLYARIFVPAGLFFFLFFQSLIQAFRFSRAFSESEAYAGRLVDLARREKEVQRLVSEERMRVYRDLHDGVSSDLHAILIALRRIRNTDPKSLPDLAENIERSATSGLNEIRELVNTDEGSLTMSYFAVWLQSLLRESAQTAGMEVDVVFPFVPPGVRLSLSVSSQLKKICREIIQNALKHSNARKLTAVLSADGAEYNLVISDDGIGFDPETVVRGSGLSSMERRADEAGLRLTRWSGEGKGTRTEIRIPVIGADVQSASAGQEV